VRQYGPPDEDAKSKLVAAPRDLRSLPEAVGMFWKFLDDDRAAVGILSAVSLAAVIGIASLAVEYGHGLLQRSDNQRAADLAAYGGALVYNSTGGNAATARSAATGIAALNGFTSGNATVTPAIVSSPRGNGNQAMQVTVNTNLPMYLAEVLTASTTLPVTATGYAEIEPDAPGCIIALNSAGTGITMSGGTNITANNCTVASNANPHTSLTLSGGATLTTQTVDYANTYSVSGGASIVAPAGKSVTYSKTTTQDPLCPPSGCIAAVTTDTGRLGTVSGIVPPVVAGGTAVTFAGAAISTPPLPTGCFDTYTKKTSTHSVACSGQPSYTFGAITVNGGVTVNFTMGAAYNFASGIAACNGEAPPYYSICNKGTALTIAGPSTFVLASGIYAKGGSTTRLGSGSTANSYNIGVAGDGESINAGTSTSVTLDDATGAGDIFKTAGNITNGGGNCLTIPAAAEHDIKGFISVAGGTKLGSGVYTLSKYFAAGDNNGGDVTCGGVSVGVSGSNVTFVIGASAMPAGTCAGQAFCVAAGFGHVTLTAPTSGTNNNLLVLGPPSTSPNPGAGAKFAQGASGTTLSGAFYIPNGPVSMSGSGNINSGGGCLELIGSQISLVGGSAAATTCAGIGGSNVGTVAVALVQ
jgi:hypothetical protein